MSQILISSIVFLSLVFSGFSAYTSTQNNSGLTLGLSTFRSIQLASDPDNGEVLTTDGTSNSWGSAGAGDITGGSSLGTGLNVFDSESSGVLRFNSIAAGSNITLSTTSNSNTIEISSTGGSGSYPFTPTSHWGTTTTATGSPLFLRGNAYSLFASSTSQFTRLNADSFSAIIGSTTNATSTNLTVTGNFIVEPLTSAIVLTGSGGTFAEYAGTSCTSQFIRSLSALGAATCATVGTADVAGLDISDDTNLAATWPVILTGDTLSFGGLSTSSTPTISHLPYFSGVNTFSSVATSTLTATYPVSVSNSPNIIGSSGAVLTLAFGTTTSNTWASTQTFSAIAGAIDAGGATSFEIPNGTGPTVDAIGEVAIDTTSNEFLYATSTAAGAPAVIKPYRTFAFAFGTSTQGSGTTTGTLGPIDDAGYFDSISCHTNSFMRVLLKDESGNRMNDLVASSTEGTVKLVTNNTVTSNEVILVDIGTTTNINSSVYGACRAKFFYSRN